MARARISDRLVIALPIAWTAAHHLYYLLPPGRNRVWCEHVTTQAAAALTCWMLAGVSAHWAWQLAMLTAAINSAQVAVCGSVAWAGGVPGWVPGMQDLCVSWLGRDVYAALASVSGAALIVIWSRR